MPPGGTWCCLRPPSSNRTGGVARHDCAYRSAGAPAGPQLRLGAQSDLGRARPKVTERPPVYKRTGSDSVIIRRSYWRRARSRLTIQRGRKIEMYTNPFNRKHSTIRQMLDRLLDPTKKPIRRSESVSSSGSNSSKGSNGSLSRSFGHGHRGILQWGRK
ncbi:hypothetical protein KM043_011049 [Ampulex compressa]|nr:hypothetical protein KM043_011049 [Ampulex compressa]